MIRIHDISIPFDEDIGALSNKCAHILGVSADGIKSINIRKKSLDARKKNDIRYIYTVDIEHPGEKAILKKAKNSKVTRADEFRYDIPRITANSGAALNSCSAGSGAVSDSAPADPRPIVAGFGPAGMFAALVLAEAGLRPIVLERGLDAEKRYEKVRRFWETGVLDPRCNVQFGEGGAGTFSDGKLTTGTRNERIRWVLGQFHAAGADESILYDAKPHIGTDVLINVVQNLRRRIVALGGEVRFGQMLFGLNFDTELRSVVVSATDSKFILPCRSLILAPGHSARDTFEMLLSSGVCMEPKAFSMGVRIEHRQSDINAAQYGASAGRPALPPADYKLAVHLPEGSVYTFCMCPGGFVVAAASEEGGVVTNGMSNMKRDGENANAAILVTLTPDDFPGDGVLSGMHWQREIERAAFRHGGGDYRAVAQLSGDFLNNRASEQAGNVTPTYAPAVRFGDIREVLPKKITDALAAAIPEFAKKLKGFDSPDAVLTAPETRSSSPVRIIRDERREASIPGLYPCGEGAGYAGGIMSAAVDGMLTAEAIIEKYL